MSTRRESNRAGHSKRRVSLADASRPDAENPEWTAEDIRRARPAMEVLPPAVVKAIRESRRVAKGERSRASSSRPPSKSTKRG
jgi:hypothetical protein